MKILSQKDFGFDQNSNQTSLLLIYSPRRGFFFGGFKGNVCFETEENSPKKFLISKLREMIQKYMKKVACHFYPSRKRSFWDSIFTVQTLLVTGESMEEKNDSNKGSCFFQTPPSYSSSSISSSFTSNSGFGSFFIVIDCKLRLAMLVSDNSSYTK